MKNFLFACFLFISSGIIAQDKSCNLWVGDISDSTQIIKQFVEKNIGLQTKLLPAGATNNIQEMRDDNELLQIKIWLKPKKVLVNGAMSTVNTISSFKVVSLSDKIDGLYAAFGSNVKQCTTASTALNTEFGTNKMFIDRNSGGFGTKGLPMSTLTVTVK